MDEAIRNAANIGLNGFFIGVALLTFASLADSLLKLIHRLKSLRWQRRQKPRVQIDAAFVVPYALSRRKFELTSTSSSSAATIVQDHRKRRA